MEIGKFYGVGDGLYLRIQTTDVVVRYVGNFLKNEIFNFLAFETLNKEPSANIKQKCVPTNDACMKFLRTHLYCPCWVYRSVKCLTSMRWPTIAHATAAMKVSLLLHR